VVLSGIAPPTDDRADDVNRLMSARVFMAGSMP
jgi:hypothetical protein